LRRVFHSNPTAILGCRRGTHFTIDDDSGCSTVEPGPKCPSRIPPWLAAPRLSGCVANLRRRSCGRSSFQGGLHGGRRGSRRDLVLTAKGVQSCASSRGAKRDRRESIGTARPPHSPPKCANGAGSAPTSMTTASLPPALTGTSLRKGKDSWPVGCPARTWVETEVRTVK
jgi:hypothetical protein